MRVTHVAIVIALVLSVLPATTRADIELSVSISPSTIHMGGEAVLVVRVEGQFRRTDAPVLPDLDDFYVYEAGTSQNFSFVNGKMNSSVEYRYTIQPRSEGRFEIAPITLTHGNQRYVANPVTVEVVKANAALPVPPGATKTTKPKGSDGTESIFVSASVDHDTVYVNQQITWSLGYYSDGRISLLRSPNYSPPAAEGFWVEDLPPQNKYYTIIDNRRYLVNEIKRGYFPTSPGVYAIGAARVDLVLDDARSGRSLFDDFFSRRGFGKQQALMTDETSVVVLPLPARGKPSDFTGVVASNLTVSISANKQVVQVGDPINIRVEINGTGNMKTVAPPTFPDMPNYKIYESGSSSDTFKKDYVITGRRIADYVIIPQEEGKWNVPSIEIPYFDPVRKRYMAAQSMAVPLEVKAGAKEEGRKVVYAGGGDNFEVINRDIRFIHPAPSALAISTSRFYGSRVYMAAHMLPFLAVVASLFVERRRRRFRDDVGFARSSRALREADRRIAAGLQSFATGSLQEGFAAVGAGLTGYFGDKMNAPPAGLTNADIEGFLRGHDVDEGGLSRVREVLTACDMARYASGSYDQAQAVAVGNDARSVLRDIEKRFLS